MALPTCQVTVRCYTQDGQPDPGALVVARLNHAEVYQGYVIPKEAIATADASGVAVLTLFRNALGSTASQYKIRIESTDGGVAKVNAVVPDAATAMLEDIASLPPYPGKPDPALDLTNYVTLAGPQALSDKTLVNPHQQEQTLADGPTITWDASNGQTAYLTLSTSQATRTLTNPTNMKPGSAYMLVVTQHPSGGQNITAFGSAISPINSLGIRSAPNSVTVIMFIALGAKVIAVNLGQGGGTVTEPPVNTVPGSQVTPFNTALVFTGANANTITVADPDSSNLTTTVSVPSGTLTAVATTGATVTNNGTSSVTIAGTPAQINAALFGLSFTPAAGFSGGVTLTVTTSDGLNADVDTIIVTVATAAGNHPPVNTVPGAQSVAHDTPHVFSGGTGNLISVADADGDALTTTVSVPAGTGTITAVAGGGATITANGTASVQIAGTIAQVNAALDGMSFTPTAGSSGAVTLTIATSDGTDTDTDTVAMTVEAAPTTQADTIQTPLVRHPVDWLVTGDYVFDDGRWGWRSSDTTQEPDLTEGPASYQFQQFMERSLIVNAEDGSVAGRWNIRWPEFNINGHAIYQNSFYSEVKTYPSIIIGKKPGFFGSSMWPAFSVAMRAADGASEPVPNPSFTPQNIKDDWQPAGGSVIQTSPSGATPGTGSTVFPMALPLTNKTCRFRGRLTHKVPPTGMGHIAFDMFLTQTAAQIQGHLQSSLTHEIMIPLGNWGNYGKHGFRNPQWYDHDVTIDGVVYHVYYAKRLPKNPVTGVIDGNPGSGLGYYPGCQYNFGGLDPVNGYINEETGQPRIGWKFIVFQHDGDNHPLSPDGYFRIDYTKFLAHLASVTDERGVPLIQNTEFLPAVEVGCEMVYGTADYVIWNYSVHAANAVEAEKPLPVFGNHAPVNTVPGAQSAAVGGTLVFSTANANTITVLDVDNDALSTTVSVDGGSVTAVAGGGATISNNGTAQVTIAGSGAQINAALDGLTFTPPGAAGAVTLRVSTSDGSITDSDTVTITVSASNGAGVLQTQFDAPNNNAGWWGSNAALTEFYTDGVGSTAPTAWTDVIGRWRNHGNMTNLHDLVQTVNANRPQLGTDAGGFHYAQSFTGHPVNSAGGSSTAWYFATMVDATQYAGVFTSDMDSTNPAHGMKVRYNGDFGKFYLDVGTGAAAPVEIFVAMPWAGSQFIAPGKRLVEAWYDGTNITLRIDKSGTLIATQALGAAMVAGAANLMFGSDVGGGSVMDGLYYGAVILKDYCPPSSDRDAIATYIAGLAGVTL